MARNCPYGQAGRIPVVDRMTTSDAGERADRESLLHPVEYRIDPDCSPAEFLAVAKVYAREVVETFDLTVSVSDLEWAVSKRAKRRAGAVRSRNGEPVEVRLTWEQFDSHGWLAAAETIRHELAHVHLLNEGVGGGHGPAFKRLAERLETPVRCERFADPTWWVTCTDCGARLARYRRSKLVEHPARYRCGDCGGSFTVERND